MLSKKAEPGKVKKYVKLFVENDTAFREAAINRISSEMCWRYWKLSGELNFGELRAFIKQSGNMEEFLTRVLPRLTHPSTIERTTFAVLDEMGIRKIDQRQQKQAEMYAELVIPDETGGMSNTSS